MKYFFIATISVFILTFQYCNQTKVDKQGNSAERNHDQLRKTLLDTLSKYKATVGLSVIELETGDTISINNNINYGMQSVYKFPLALTILSEVEKGKISLGQKVFASKEMLGRFSRSPLKRQNPRSDLYISVDSLLMYMVGYSDNLACDLLFDLVGGTKAADKFIHEKGFPDIHIRYTEHEMGEEHDRMYLNSSTPNEMTSLLKAFYERKIIGDSGTKYLLNFMTNDSTSHKRMIDDLPSGTKVAHKTGTGSYNDTLINACNDVGIIFLPNGKHLAITVFVMNSKENYDDTEKLIAIITKNIFDYYK
jgi:beta-lactamase class A